MGDGRVFTSAGVAAGLDLCLHLVGLDHGPEVAAATARAVVMAPKRHGGRAQFIDPTPPNGDSLARTLAWMREHAHEPLRLPAIAAHAGVPVRTLTRRFREQTGTTSLGWLQQEQLRRTRRLLETTDLPVPDIARQTGHGSVSSLRAQIERDMRTSPSATVRRSERHRVDIPPDIGSPSPLRPLSITTSRSDHEVLSSGPRVSCFQ